MSHHESEPNILKQRVRDLYRFLREANQLRFRPVRRLADQPRSIDLFSLPKHPCIQINRPMPTVDGSEVPDKLVSVRRPNITRCMQPPPEVLEWLVAGWDNPSKAAEIVPSMNIVDADGEPITLRFEDDGHRVALYREWLKLRDAWAAPEVLARSAMATFEAIYEFHAALEKEAETLELLIADGHLSWKATSNQDGVVDINHPILLKRVELRFDPNKPEFTVHETDREPELYGGLFVDLVGISAGAIKSRGNELAASGYHPLGWEDVDAFLKAFIQTVSPLKGEYVEQPAPLSDTPRLWRSPVLLMRKRVSGIAHAIDAIIEDIEQQEVFPPALGLITGTGDGEWTGGGFGGPESAASPSCSSHDIIDDILLAREANEEQLQIIRRLTRSGSVIVQGPPGTGKTHTIGNIIGHLLANGKSVLVTSHTTKALRVLRDKVPKELQPLCVSVLGSDADARKQLESAIASITERLTQGDALGLLKRAEGMLAERVKLIAKTRQLGAHRRKALENEYRPLIVHEREFAPSDAARHVAQYRPTCSWIPSPVRLGIPMPLSGEELIRLYALTKMFSIEDEQDANLPIPNLSALPSERQFEVMVDEYQSLTTTDLTFGQEKWTGTGNGSEAIAELATELAMEFSNEYRQQQWRPYAIVAGIHGGTVRDVWERVIVKIEEACEAAACHAMVLHHRPTLSQNIPLARQKQIANSIITHLEGGGGLGMLHLVFKSEWKGFIKASSVASGTPNHKDHFDALYKLAHLEEVRLELGAIWDGVIGQTAGISFGSLGYSPEQACRALIPEIRRCLDWHKNSWLPLVARLKAEGFKYDDIAAVQPREASSVAEYLLIERLAVEIIPQLLEKEGARRRLVECERAFKAIEELSIKAERENPDRGCIGRILVAVRYRNKEGYAAALAYSRHIMSIKPLVDERGKLLEKLRPVAPGWAEQVAARIVPHDEVTMPGDHSAAWVWRQLHDELADRDKLDVQELQVQIDKTRLTLRELTTALIDSLAWGKQMLRLQNNNAVRQALVGWLDTAKRLISTRRVDRRQQLLIESRKLMKLCAKAVPVWVMPISVMAESFDPKTTRFDVVIIDEASQADLNALIPLYMAKQIVIVGDHEQVTPLGVGKDQGMLENLRKQILQEIPNGHLYDNMSSIYDIGRQSFGDAIRLAEHFRCVPEIIAFSNQLSYEGSIRPLRETNSSHLKPACVTYRVDGVREGKVNPVEANAIVGFIEAMIKHPAYAGKTIGVISMLGDEQAIQIESMILKRIPSIEIETRRIQAGSSAQFQGDERDVMLLSFIDSQGDEKDGFLRAQGEGAFELMKKRFNVATSRARDQLWAFYSFDPERHLRPGDMRLKLLEHMKNPWAAVEAYSNEEKKADSDFERQVMKRLIDAGYRVKAQWQVGYYRIDLVVEGDGKRLAIECDGDRYHPLEKLEDDLARQTVLERLGWQFVRIRGSAFYRSPYDAMKPVFERLEELGIPPVGQDAEERRDDRTLIYELEEIVYENSLSDEDPIDINAEPHQSESKSSEGPQESDQKVHSELSLVDILRAIGGRVHIDDLLRRWSLVRGYKRIGKNIREAFDTELRVQELKRTIVVSDNIVRLL
ncbi:MAG: DUF559 domain-containing protein [Deltaproteobacteria bacterium]|nr:DUF559 domain-containing protein [Deltaproteobacteria bacterium]TLN01494.1 MAG: DUF559 domain-containing protein [bacterium]